MTLGRDIEGRSTIKTVEKITAVFPQTDHKRGLERIFVKSYNNHPTNLNLVSVADEKGNDLQFHWSGDNLRIGDADVYVHGEQTYVITFTERDVTRYYEDNNRDEFYWDVIGQDWRVPISNASISVSIDTDLTEKLTDKPSCFKGEFGANNPCNVTEAAAGTWVANAQGLNIGEGVTMAFGFPQGTFVEYQKSALGKLLEKIIAFQVVGGIISVIGTFWVVIYSARQGIVRKSQLGPIAAEYIPPKDYSVTVSSKVLGLSAVSRSGSAQMIDLAVRHYIKLYEVKEKSFWRSAEYEIEITKDLSGLRPEEVEIIKDMFGGSIPKIGQKLNMKSLRTDNAYGKRTMDNSSKVDKLARGEYGLYVKDSFAKRLLRAVGIVSMVLAVVIWPLAIFGFMSIVISFAVWKPTEKAIELRRYLEGLKMYIGMAEKDRLKFSQSVEGAQRVPEISEEGSSPERQLIKIYERVLPYAILFGQEKSWSQELAKYYELTNVQPDWYSGMNGKAFTAAAFTNSLSNFSSSTASSTSSSSGGSSGGGFSGGGGGGGGGGGW
ncbi:MAG: DUF2207 domain-containing protein, partial [Cumulibacter sp.]